MIENENLIDKIADILLQESKKAHIGFNILLKEASKILRQAPLIIAIYNTKTISSRFLNLGMRYKKLCELFETQSVAAATQNISLAASVLELGLAWIGIALFCEFNINKLLKQDGALMAILSVGYPAESPKAPSRKAIRDISIFL